LIQGIVPMAAIQGQRCDAGTIDPQRTIFPHGCSPSRSFNESIEGVSGGTRISIKEALGRSLLQSQRTV
jgi:hypothetical protein